MLSFRSLGLNLRLKSSLKSKRLEIENNDRKCPLSEVFIAPASRRMQRLSASNTVALLWPYMLESTYRTAARKGVCILIIKNVNLVGRPILGARQRDDIRL